MFAFQTMNNKRRREDDSDSDDGGYEQHHFKKSKSWFSNGPNHGQPQLLLSADCPLRPSPPPPRTISDLEAMTPAQSDHSESPEPHLGVAVESSQSDYMDDDMEMDDDNQDVTSQPPDSPFASTFMRPAMLNASLFAAEPINASNGRLPTPIHPTFKRSGLNGLGFPTSGAAGGLHTSGAMAAPSMQAPMSRKTNKQEADVDRSRRMPSPISEDEDIPDTPTAFTQSQLARLSFSQSNPADQMDTESIPTTLVLPPTPRGRKRSGAFTGMGRFSMGYRDDCEKCRQKVPGHYSHFLP